MCNPSMQRQSSQFRQTPETPEQTAARQRRLQREQQMYLKKKPLTAQEQEQRRSESMAFEAGGFSGANPYETLPKSRMEGFQQFRIQRQRQALSGAPPYARA